MLAHFLSNPFLITKIGNDKFAMIRKTQMQDSHFYSI